MKMISKSYKRLVAAEIQINRETLLAVSTIKRRLATSGWQLESSSGKYSPIRKVKVIILQYFQEI